MTSHFLTSNHKMTANGPHANPVWSTFVFVVCMLLFLFYLESMVNPMDFHVSKSFVVHEYHVGKNQPVLNLSNFVSHDDIIRNGSFDINIIGNTLVSLNIQNTGSNEFITHVTLDVRRDSGPGCNCEIPKPNDTSNMPLGSCVCDHESRGKSQWFFSQLTMGWPCGIHAGWTDVTLACLDKALRNQGHNGVGQRYATITMLREPLIRYVLEWQQVNAHGQWSIEHIHCHPLQGNNYFNGNWTGVTLDAFIRCPDNPSNNRQVRMLADLENTRCPDVTHAITRSHQYATPHPDYFTNISTTLLESAKNNLKRLSFFGIQEYLPETDQLFEYTFGIGFSKPLTNTEITPPVKLTAYQRETIADLNQFDRKLYDFAKELFFERLDKMSKM